MSSNRFLIACVLTLPLLLGACDGVRDTLGLTRQGPDEFGVATSPPLVMPPEFTLRPPAPGTAGPQGIAASEQAKNVLLGKNGTTTNITTASGGEAALLQQAGSIPAKTDTVTSQPVNPQAAILDTVLFGKPVAGATAPAISMSRDSNGWFDWL